MSEDLKPIPEPPDPVLTPEQLETAGFFPARFRRTANSLAALYGAPVYLVGSALDSRRRARDIDVRVIVAELDWVRLFRTPFFDPQVPHYDNNLGQLLRLQENLKRSRDLHATFKERTTSRSSTRRRRRCSRSACRHGRGCASTRPRRGSSRPVSRDRFPVDVLG